MRDSDKERQTDERQLEIYRQKIQRQSARKTGNDREIRRYREKETERKPETDTQMSH